ncbi:MAG TPA: hypothetical protein VLG76_06240 [Rhabdochlamydiaceae bacterium]|nr:hypothetical protein [Rhabdochlamydiaceae bacterium]
MSSRWLQGAQQNRTADNGIVLCTAHWQGHDLATRIEAQGGRGGHIDTKCCVTKACLFAAPSTRLNF